MRANNVSFNHDSSCVVVATENGFRILKADSGALLHKFDAIGPMRICEMLRDTRLIVCVGDGGGLETPDLSPRRLKILNVDWETLIADLAFRTTVRSVKMNRHVLVVCEDEEVTVFEMKGLTRVMNVPQRNVNAEGKGVMAINSDAVSASDFSSSSEKGEEKEETKNEKATNTNSSYLAVVSHLSETTVVIYDLHNVHVATEIPNAHEGPVAMLAFSQKGDILASCSVKGTVVRTWDVPSGEPRNIFRRGATTAEITSLQFAYSSERFAFEPELLAVASDSGTAHVFQCFESATKSSSSNEEEGKEDKDEKDEKEIDEEKKVEAIEAKYNASSASTAHKILRLGGLVSKLALTGAKKVTKTSVNALAKVSSTVLHTTGVSTKFTKSFLEPKRAAAVIKLPAHKRMAAARNEKFAIGLGSGESNLQVDVVNTNKVKAAAVPSPTQSRVEWNVVSIRPPADFNHDAKTIIVGSKSSSQKKDVALNTPPSLNPDDEDEDVGDTTNEDVKKELTKRVRVVCASSTGILYDYRVRLKSSVQAVNNDDDDDDDGENNSPLLETTASSTTTTTNNNKKSECALEREIAMLTPGASETTTTTTRFTGFSGWRRPGSSSSNSSFSKKQQTQQKQKQQQPSTADEEENALKYSMMQASQLRSPSSHSTS